jgi:hypothetical protein|tara:strand:+ start:2382 stop:2762 length:381 start_codon:yes stop_codon:yes gene_type:complete
MSSISDRMKALQQDQDKFCIEVAELGVDGEPLHIYFTKMTVREDERIRKQHPDFYNRIMNGDIPSFASLLDLIMLKAKNEEGKKIFDEGDRQAFLGMDINFVTNISSQMLEKLFAEDISLEASEKK